MEVYLPLLPSFSIAGVVDLDTVNPELPRLLNYINSELRIQTQIFAIYQIFLEI
jgi:hypothetical protein